MEHLENHPQAFVNANGVVVNVAIFQDHDDALIADCLKYSSPPAEKAIDCCAKGEAKIGQIWTGRKFVDPTPVEEPPVEEAPLEETPAETPTETPAEPTEG